MRVLTSIFGKSALAVVLLAGGFTLSLNAQEPAELVEQLYTPYVKPDAESPLPPIISAEAADEAAQGYLTGELKKAVEKLAKAQDADPELSLGHDPLVDAQDFELKEFKITPREGGTDTAKDIAVEFLNFGEKRRYLFRFVKPEGGKRWLLSEVKCELGSEGRSYDLRKEVEEALTPDTE